MWYVEAGKYKVMPIDSRGTLRFADERPKIAVDRTSYVFYPHTQGVPVNATVNILNRPHSITADVEIPKDGAEGVLLSQGGNDGGYSLLCSERQAPLCLQLRRPEPLLRRICRGRSHRTSRVAL